MMMIYIHIIIFCRSQHPSFLSDKQIRDGARWGAVVSREKADYMTASLLPLLR
jgi:hypothetical protein